MDATKLKGNNPWLGLSTYPEGARLYGRDTEVSALMDIITNNLSAVVYGRSGIGKSSLIHAGITPEIRKRGMQPVYIRFDQNSDTSYIDQIKAAVSKELKKEDRLGGGVPDMGLWDFFHRNVFYNEHNEQTTPVIIIDQFEEIYTLADTDHKRHAQELFEEMADLLNNVKPEKVIAYEAEATQFTRLKIDLGLNDALSFRVHSEEKLNYTDSCDFHLLICLREDYLYYLERNTSRIPSFKVNRFSLHALTREEASDVILLPCPGLFSPSDAEEIMSRISSKDDEGKEEIDPTILSIFLYKYFDSKGNVKSDNIINEFYNDATRQISGNSLAYLEDNLITGEGFRHFVPYNDALSNGITKQELEHLIQSRILTLETRKGHNYLEFSHDIICPIAIAHREQRKIDLQARTLRKRILITTALAFLAIILIGSFSFLNHLVSKRGRELMIEKTKNDSFLAHYMIVRGDVLNAIDTLLGSIKETTDKDGGILPETERVLNEAYDSLFTPFSCIAVLKHTDDVTTAEYSEDARYIVTASADGFCRIWDVPSGQLIKALDSGIMDMTGASMDRTGTKVITSFRDGSILIWNVTTGKVELSLKGHTDDVNYACFSPDGRYALSASDDCTVKLWDTVDGNCLGTIVEHRGSVNCAVFNNAGDKIITSSEDGTAVIYDLVDKTSKVIFHEEDCSVEYAEFNYDDTKIAVITKNSVKIIDAPSYAIKHSLDRNDTQITSASFSPDGKTIATSSHDKTILLWDIASEKVIHTYSGHSNIVKDVVFSPDGNFILSTSTDNEARIWNTGNPEFHNTIQHNLGVLASVTYSPSGKFIAAISVMGKAAVWDTGTKDEIFRFEIPDIANSIVFDRAEDKLVITSDSNIIRLFDIPSRQISDSVEIAGSNGFDYAFFCEDDDSIIAYSHDAKTILYNLKEKSVSGIDIDSIVCLTMGNNPALCLMSASKNNSFNKWDLSSGSSQKCYKGHSKEVRCMKFSNDAKKIISGSSDNTAIIWDAETGEIIYRLKGHSSQVYFAEFSRDDKYALTASTDGTVRIWNVITGKEVAARRAPTSPMYTYMVCPDADSYIIDNNAEITFHNLYSPTDLIHFFKTINQQ